MNRLQGKVAIVTGASSGIGRATAKLFAAEGASVVVGARREQELKSLVQEILAHGGDACFLAGDVNEEEYNRNLVQMALSRYKKLDIAFNNAGAMGKAISVTDQPLQDWHHIVNTNLTSGFLAAKFQIPAMKSHGGSIIFTSSFVGNTVGFPQQAAYAASKAGLIGLTYSLASEYSSQGLRINAILPGGTNTPMAAEFGDSPEVQEFVKGIHAIKRISTPEEIAKSVLYLASEDSSFTTGSALLVDGGVSICKS